MPATRKRRPAARPRKVRALAAKTARSEVPESSVSIVSLQAEPPAIAREVTVPRLHDILSTAEGGYTRDLFALYRDILLSCLHLQAELAKRKLAILGDVLVFQPADKNDPDDVDLAQAISTAVLDLEDWLPACAHLLDACLYPVSLLEKVFTPEAGGYSLARLIPVPYQLLDWTRGRLMLYDVDPQTLFPAGSLHEVDPLRYIVHRGHLLSAPDNWGGPMRSVLFWWLLATMDLEWWARFLERYGCPFPVGKFRDPEGKSVLQRAFSLATRLGGLVVSEGTEVSLTQAAATDSAAAYQAFQTMCEREMSKLVVGQTLSAEVQPTGLGEGTSRMHEGIRQDIRKFDARLLMRTMRNQLLRQLVEINQWSGALPSAMWGADSSEQTSSLTASLEALARAGLRPSDGAILTISERVGFELERSPSGLQSFSATPLFRRSP